MKRVIDLSHRISHGMPVFPGDPVVEFERVLRIPENGYNVTRISMGSHTGTHIDVPSHVTFSDRFADNVPLDALVGWAEVLDLGRVEPGTEITAAHLDVFAHRVDTGARILVKTGWSERFGEAAFFENFPGLTEGAAMWLNARKPRLVGIEQPSVHPFDHLQVHRLLLTSGAVLVESIDLREVAVDRVFLAVLPLKLAGLDGAPARAVAIVDEDETQ